MELADDIAYGVHDLEDAVVTGTLTEQQWCQHFDGFASQLDSPLAQQFEALGKQLFAEHHQRKDAIGALVNLFVTEVRITEVLPSASEPLIRYNATLPNSHRLLLDSLKSIVFEYVINQAEIQQLRYRSQHMLLDLFSAFHSDPERLLPGNTRLRWRAAFEQFGQASADRILCDYIAGMTDDYAERMYRNLFIT
jgi:dGTPase